MDKLCEQCSTNGIETPAEHRALWFDEMGETEGVPHYVCGECLRAGAKGGPGYAEESYRISMDPLNDLREAQLCACDGCRRAFAEALVEAAEDVAERNEVGIEIVICSYGSPRDHRTDHGDTVTRLWQECHNDVVWGDSDRPDDCDQRFAARASEAISDAIDAWTECDWCHERTDAGGIVYDKNDDPVYCEGGNADECETCEKAKDAAEEAQRCGRQALEHVEQHDFYAAWDEVEQAVGAENDWGDAPVWGPVAKMFADQLGEG